jgi:cytochrome c-type biogenesis protein CcmH
MSRIILILVLQIFFFLLPLKAENITVNEVLKNIRCLVCQGQSISDSNSDFAITIRSVVEDKIDEGLSKQEIYNFLSSRYGDWILLKPILNKYTYLLWFLPYILLAILGIIFYRSFKKKM